MFPGDYAPDEGKLKSLVALADATTSYAVPPRLLSRTTRTLLMGLARQQGFLLCLCRSTGPQSQESRQTAEA